MAQRRFRMRFWWWGVLLAISAIIHAVISWQGSLYLGLGGEGTGEERTVELVITDAKEEEEEQLRFDDPLNLDPPESVVAAASPIIPPLDARLAPEAAAGGAPPVDLPSSALLENLTAATPTGGAGSAGYGLAIGHGLTKSQNQFAAYIQGLRDAGLDIVFVIDTTGSMGWVISEVRERLVDIVDAVRSIVPLSRFGIVAYRDRDGPEYTTRVRPLTYSLRKLDQFVRTTEAKGGGDWYEAIDRGMSDAVEKSGWRAGAARVIILIGDAPPHPSKLSGVLATARRFRDSGGHVSTLDVRDDANPAVLAKKLGRPVNPIFYTQRPMLEFDKIAEMGGGVSSTLQGDARVTRQIVSLIFGGQFRSEMALLIEGWD